MVMPHTGETSGRNIRFTLPCDGQWLTFAQKILTSYSRQVGFSQKLETMVTLSVMEALEELFQKAAALPAPSQVCLDLDGRGEAVVIDITYDRSIAFHPHETADWEVPDDLDGLDEQGMETLWLHLIKKRMDRVCFMTRGKTCTFRMAKYRREQGRETQAWIMAVRPKLRPEVVIHLDDPEKEFPSSVIQQPGMGVLRLGPSETFLVRAMDGQTSFHDLYMAHVEALGLVSPAALVALYEQLENKKMLAGETPEKQGLAAAVKKIINPDLVVPASDRIVTWCHRRLRPLYSKAGAAAFLALGFSGLIPVVMHQDAFLSQIAGLEHSFAQTPWLFVLLYGMVLAGAALHELGHGTMCKHFGGDVHRMGVMFYLASFIFYCDTTASLNFRTKKARLLVSLAGPLVSFALLGIGLWGTSLVFGASVESWAAPVMTAFCLITALGLVMNFNPFIRMDAYYMLSDLTGISNLRKKSFAFIRSRLANLLGRGGIRGDAFPSGHSRTFWIYGIGGIAVTALIMVLPFARLFHFLGQESARGGAMVLALAMLTLVCLRLGHLAFAQIHAMRNREYKIQ